MAPALFPSLSLFISLLLYELLVSYTLFLSLLLSLHLFHLSLSISIFLSLFRLLPRGCAKEFARPFAVGDCPSPALPPPFPPAQF